MIWRDAMAEVEEER